MYYEIRVIHIDESRTGAIRPSSSVPTVKVIGGGGGGGVGEPRGGRGFRFSSVG
jgi:hypothetical protein